MEERRDCRHVLVVVAGRRQLVEEGEDLGPEGLGGQRCRIGWAHPLGEQGQPVGECRVEECGLVSEEVVEGAARELRGGEDVAQCGAVVPAERDIVRAVRIKRRRRAGSIGLRGLAISHLAGCRWLVLEPSGYSLGWSSVRPLPLAGGQADGGQQSRKALLDDVVAPGDAPVLALALGMHEPRLAQHPEVVRHRGLDDVVAQVPAVQGAFIGDPAKDVATDGV